jgi:hypothetical protein
MANSPSACQAVIVKNGAARQRLGARMRTDLRLSARMVREKPRLLLLLVPVAAVCFGTCLTFHLLWTNRQSPWSLSVILTVAMFLQIVRSQIPNEWRKRESHRSGSPS